MMRPAPKKDATKIEIEKLLNKPSGYITQTREYKLITPLFGGGVTPGEADPVTVVRATEIRGHLRFWWRACRAGQFGDNIGKMKKKEDEIWGAAAKEGKDGKETGGPSKVQVVVTPLSEGHKFQVEWRQRGQEVKNTEVGNPRSPYSYVAFPLNEKKGTVREGITFQLSITFLETYREEVESALWAWETFGGIGARTRRGFGALKLLKIDGQDNKDLPSANSEKVKSWLQDKFAKHVSVGNFPQQEPIPHLAPSMQCVVTQGNSEATEVWRNLIKKLKDFRHQRPNPPGKNHPGRNRWPEPSTIREITGRSDPRHKTPIPNPLIKKFPRAAFGLPIIFEFKRDDQKAGDPPGRNTLQGESTDSQISYDRFSSPLIFRPIACANNQFVGIALILEGTKLPEKLVLILGNGKKKEVSSKLYSDEASQIMCLDDKTPLLGKETNVLKVFLNTLGSEIIHCEKEQ